MLHLKYRYKPHVHVHVFPLILACALLDQLHMQHAVLQVLKEASRLNPNVLLKQLEDVKHKHRTDRCDCTEMDTYTHLTMPMLNRLNQSSESSCWYLTSVTFITHIYMYKQCV